jgi:dTDP-4-dehydrorhamnose reductase
LKTRSKIVVVGSGGRLGAALLREYRDKFDVVGFNHAQLDLANADEMRKKLSEIDFDVLINAAAFTNVDHCETERSQAFQVNAQAPRILAEVCRDKNAKLIHFSTDYVFDGEKHEPYTEEDAARPISVYGESKCAGEQNVLALQDRHLVVRVSWVFGADRPSFIDAMIKRAQKEEHVDAIANKFSTPTYTCDIAKMLPRFFAGVAVAGGANPCSTSAVNACNCSGLLHFANAGECSWQEYAQWALDCCQTLGVPLKTKTVGAAKMKDMTHWVARRPIYSVLSSAKYTKLSGISPRAWRDAVADYIRCFYSTK